MTLAPGRYDLGPDQGRVRIRTSRQGVAARAGHDLLIEFAQWSGQLVLDDPDTASVTVEIELDSLQIVEGTGGVLPLSGDDRTEITSTARRLLDVERYPTAHYESSRITRTDVGGTIEGMLSVHGESGSVPIAVQDTGAVSWRGTASLLQSAFGIKPYKAFFGALRLADEIRVEVDLDLSAAAGYRRIVRSPDTASAAGGGP